MKKVISLVLSAVMTVALSTSAFAVGDYADADLINSTYSWAKEDIDYVADLGIMVGDENHNFNPGQNVTRAEFIIMVARTMYKDEVNSRASERQPGRWWDVEYDVAVDHNLISASAYRNNSDDDYMKQPMTREEMAVVLMNCIKAKGETIPSLLVNINSIPDYQTVYDGYKGAVRQAYSMGLLNGTTAEGHFDPRGNMLRCSSAAVIHRLLDASARKAPDIDKFTSGGGSTTPVSGPQTWVEGQPHEKPKVGDTVIKADGTKVVLQETTLRDGTKILGYGSGADIITGTKTTVGNDTYKVGDNAWYSNDGTTFQKSSKTGEVYSAQQWNLINSTFKPIGRQGSYAGEVYNIYWEWDAVIEDWLFNYR